MDYHDDNKFSGEYVHEMLNPYTLHIFIRDKHIPKIERSVIIIKNQSQCVCHAVPYRG